MFIWGKHFGAANFKYEANCKWAKPYIQSTCWRTNAYIFSQRTYRRSTSTIPAQVGYVPDQHAWRRCRPAALCERCIATDTAPSTSPTRRVVARQPRDPVATAGSRRGSYTRQRQTYTYMCTNWMIVWKKVTLILVFYIYKSLKKKLKKQMCTNYTHKDTYSI